MPSSLAIYPIIIYDNLMAALRTHKSGLFEMMEEQGYVVTRTGCYFIASDLLLEGSIEDLRASVPADLRAEMKDGKVKYFEIVTDYTSPFQMAHFIHLLRETREDTVIGVRK